MRRRGGGLPRGWRALMVLLAIALPLACAVIALAAHNARQSYVEAFKARLHASAINTRMTVDSRLAAYLAAAQTLAFSDQLQEGGDPLALYDQARQTGEAIGGWIVVEDMRGPDMPQLLNTRLPRDGGTMLLPPVRQPALQAYRETIRRDLKPTVSDIFRSPVSGRLAVVIAAPVLERRAGPAQGSLRAVVAVLVDVERFQSVLMQQPRPEGAIGSILDSSRRVIAHTGKGPQSAGEALPRQHSLPDGRRDGLVEDLGNHSNRPVVFAIEHPELAPNWQINVFEPVASIDAVTAYNLRPLLLAAATVPLLLLAALLMMWRSSRDDRRAYEEMDRILAHVPNALYVDFIAADGQRTREFRTARSGAVLGYSREEVIALGDDAVRTLDAPERARFETFRAAVRRDGQGSVEVRTHPRDGSVRVLHYDESCFERFADGSMMVAGAITDITQITVAKDRARQMEKLAVLGEVAAGIAHEMNQPLAAISMAAENAERALARPAPDLERVTDKLTVITRQTHRIAQVINHIGLFGRSDAGDVDAINIAGVINGTLILLDGRLRHEAITVTTEIEDELPRVRGATVMLEQVMINICANAIDAYRERPQLSERPLHIRARACEGKLLITVADRAGGIPSEVLPRIFDPFFTTKATGVGTGLDLSISYATVADMGGTISVRNESAGALFEIVLPPAESAPAGGPAGLALAPGALMPAAPGMLPPAAPGVLPPAAAGVLPPAAAGALSPATPV